MDAASYAVERNRNLQDNVQKIIQMMLMGKQNKQEQDWRQGQFDYQKSQDVINQGQQDRALERQDAQQKRYEEYQRAQAQHYANQDRLAAERPVKAEKTYDEIMKEYEEKAKIDAKYRTPANPPVTPSGDKPTARMGKVLGETSGRYSDELKNQQKALDDLMAVDAKGVAKKESTPAQREAIKQRIKNIRVAMDDLNSMSYQLNDAGDLDVPTRAKLEGYTKSLSKVSTAPLTATAGGQWDVMTRPMPKVQPGTPPAQVVAPVTAPDQPVADTGVMPYEELRKVRPDITKAMYDVLVAAWNKQK
jgi:hypothetical protein